MSVKIMESGDLFKSGCSMLVNATNVLGIMNAGIAKAFKHEFPEYFYDYDEACAYGEHRRGVCHFYDVPPNTDNGMYVGKSGNKYTLPLTICSFPSTPMCDGVTTHTDIEDSLNHLRQYIKSRHIESVAIPALGSGIGNYKFEDLEYRVVSILGDLNCEILLYKPKEK